jgi:hypothetical protein
MNRKPRFSPDELWEKIRNMHKTDYRFHSLVLRREYRIAKVNEELRTYSVEYESGKCRKVPLSDLDAIYREVYVIGEMKRDYLRNEGNNRRIVGHGRYSGSPGATIYGILAALDENIITDEGGNLRLQ